MGRDNQADLEPAYPQVLNLHSLPGGAFGRGRESLFCEESDSRPFLPSQNKSRPRHDSRRTGGLHGRDGRLTGCLSTAAGRTGESVEQLLSVGAAQASAGVPTRPRRERSVIALGDVEKHPNGEPRVEQGVEVCLKCLDAVSSPLIVEAKDPDALTRAVGPGRKVVVSCQAESWPWDFSASRS